MSDNTGPSISKFLVANCEEADVIKAAGEDEAWLKPAILSDSQAFDEIDFYQQGMNFGEWLFKWTTPDFFEGAFVGLIKALEENARDGYDKYLNIFSGNIEEAHNSLDNQEESMVQ
jgi:hypothetical protein